MKTRCHAQRRCGWPQLNWAHLFWFSLIQAVVVLGPFTFCWSVLVLCAILYLLAGFGVTIGYHRLPTQRSFQTSRGVEYLPRSFLASGKGGRVWSCLDR